MEDKKKQEVDFIIEKEQILIPVEVKIKSRGKINDYRRVLKFLSDYHQKKGYVLSANFNKITIKRKKDILFVIAINFINKIFTTSC